LIKYVANLLYRASSDTILNIVWLLIIVIVLRFMSLNKFFVNHEHHLSDESEV
jgi:hypothetical protein